MSSPPQSEYDHIRVLLFRGEVAELLLEPTEEGLRLPDLAIPRFTRVAEELTAAIDAQWKMTAYCLFSLPANENVAFSNRYQVAETDRATATPNGKTWFAVASLTLRDFVECADFEAIERSVATFDLYRRNERHDFFGKSGWLQVVTEWVEAGAARLGLRLTGKFRQLNACPTFSLIRFETNGPALWFKAVGEPNLHEYGITLGLAEYFPTYSAQVIASNPDWNAWLSLEVRGQHLAKKSPLTDWQNAATALADLQIASYGNGLHLIEMGCRDLRASVLLERLEPFFDCMARLVEGRTTPASLTRSEIVTIRDEVRCALQDLAESETPNVLGHLDCNPGNILVTRKHVVFLDWAGGFVGHPFLTFEYLHEWWSRLRGHGAGSENQLRRAYLSPWQRHFSREVILRDLSLAPLLAAFLYAASSPFWRDRDQVRPETARYFESLLRRMKSEADHLEKRTILCFR